MTKCFVRESRNGLWHSSALGRDREKGGVAAGNVDRAALPTARLAWSQRQIREMGVPDPGAKPGPLKKRPPPRQLVQPVGSSSNLGASPSVTMGQNTSFGGLPLSAGALFQLSAVVSVLWLGYIAIYRLYLSPIAKFPGPKLAALTGAYEGYYDCLKDGGGRYYVEINRMHDKYGRLQ